MQHTSDSSLYTKATHYMPGGVNSPVRAFKGVGGDPLFFNRAEGAYLFATDNTQYIDYVGSWGPMILGHAHPKVIESVQNTIKNSLSFGAPCPLEVELAQLITQIMPSIEKVRMVNSGTEATMTAIRLARGITGRDKIIKFEGCYHGHSDSLLVKAGSGALTLGVPSSPGVPTSVANDTLTANFNDLDSVEQLFQQHPSSIATVILEPIAGNMNLVLPKRNFLKELHAMCKQYGALLIIDEVMTGFRVALGGAQSLYDITPDITTLGKVIGGGMPVGAIGGKQEIMDQLAPVGPIYQAGTLSGNPVAMAAGIATLQEIMHKDFFDNLTSKAKHLTQGLSAAAKNNGIDFHANSIGGMFGMYFTAEKNIENYHQVTTCNLEQFKQFYHGMLDQGIYFAPSAYEAGFISNAHSNDDIEKTVNAADKCFKQLLKVKTF